MKKLFSFMTAALLLCALMIPADAQVPPGLMRFGTTGVFAPQVGNCLSIMAMNSSGQVATDSGVPCAPAYLTTAYTNATTGFTSIMALPAVAGAVTVTGECFLTWESSSTSGTPTFAIGNSVAPTDLWNTSAYAGGTYVAPTYTTIAAGAVGSLGGTIATTGTAGQFSFTAGTGLAVGNYVQVTGTLAGTGTITGYTTGTVYYVSATNGTSTFTLQTAAQGAIVTTAGTITGLTFAPFATAVTGALVTTGASTPYQVRLTFTLQNAAAADIVTIYAESNSTSYTITVEPGSFCTYLP